MQQPLPGADVRLDLLVGVAEHLLPARRVHDRAGFEVPVPDAFLRAGEGQLQPLLALAQRRFGALALGDVEVRADDADDRAAGLAADRKAAREHVDVVTVLVAQAELAFVGRALAAATLSFSGRRAALSSGMKQPLPGADVRLDLLVGVTEHLLPSRRVHDGAGFEVPVPHAFLRAGEGEPEALLALAQRGLGAPTGSVTSWSNDLDCGRVPGEVQVKTRRLDVQLSCRLDERRRRR